MKHLYHECMALEELLEEAVHVLGPDARDILAQIQLYIEEEIYLPENQTPPLGEGFPLTSIRSKARNYRCDPVFRCVCCTVDCYPHQ